MSCRYGRVGHVFLVAALAAELRSCAGRASTLACSAGRNWSNEEEEEEAAAAVRGVKGAALQIAVPAPTAATTKDMNTTANLCSEPLELYGHRGYDSTSPRGATEQPRVYCTTR